MIRKWIAAAALVLCSTVGAAPAWAGTWQYQAAEQPGPGVENGGWQYRLDDGTVAPEGWIEDQNKWYYIGADGFMKTGWIEWKEAWYYLDETGAMVSGTSRVIDGTGYAFDENGALAEGPSEVMAGGWNGTTFTSSRLNYQVTVPEGFVPLETYMDLYVDDTMTLDLSAAAPDMTVSLVVVTYDKMDEEFRGMDAGELAAVMGQGLGGYEEYVQIGEVEMVTLGSYEYAKLPVMYTGLLNQELYFRWAGDSIMMIEIVYDPYREAMAEKIIQSIR